MSNFLLILKNRYLRKDINTLYIPYLLITIDSEMLSILIRHISARRAEKEPRRGDLSPVRGGRNG